MPLDEDPETEVKPEPVEKIVKEIPKKIEVVLDSVKPKPIEKDTVVVVKRSFKNVLDFSKIDTTKIERIHYPADVPDFVKTLSKNLNRKSCRMIHYGDSQLEGDRITSYLRNRFQKIYGGSGPGFIPCLLYTSDAADD